MNRQQLLESIASTTADYRAGELPTPTPAHVDRWAQQFNADAQLAILAELDHVLKCTYFSRSRVETFLTKLATNEDLAGKNPCAYWRKANFLDIQRKGHSQKEMLTTFSAILENTCGFTIDACGSEDGDFVFLDDAIFSGTGISHDLSSWIEEAAPAKARVNIISIVLYTGSEWVFRVPIAEAIKRSGKKISFQHWRAKEFENQKNHRNISEVFWPVGIPDYADVKSYVASEKKFAFDPRTPGGKTKHPIFSSEEGRQILEFHLLSAGVRIRGFCKEPSPILRPLGFSRFGLGFGSTIVTYRNCPNNAPLALWWGDPGAPNSHPFSKWYPLFPRKTYDHGVASDDFDIL
jgi:hypothetical protein